MGEGGGVARTGQNLCSLRLALGANDGRQLLLLRLLHIKLQRGRERVSRDSHVTVSMRHMAFALRRNAHVHVFTSHAP